MLRGLDGYLPDTRLDQVNCAVLRARRAPVSQTFGGHSEGETPLPIPNRAVKPLSADGTWLARAWESRSPPVFHEVQIRRRPPEGGLLALHGLRGTPVWQARSVANGGEAGLIARSHGAGAAGADADEWSAVRMGTALVGEARLRAVLVDEILERRQGTRGRHGPEQEAPDA